MSSDDYEAYCAMPTDDDESHNRLHAGLTKFGLKQLQLPAPPAQPLRSDGAGAPTMARQPSSTAAAPHSLMRALVTAAQQLGTDSARDM